MTPQDKIISDLKKDIHLARVLIRELKQGKKDMKQFYQAEIATLQDKIKELLSEKRDAAD